MFIKSINFIKKILKNPFFTGSLIMVIGLNIFNVGQFVYHFLAGRLLGRAGYGDLAAILSILGIISIIQSAFGMTIIKFISGEKSKNGLANFIKWIYWWAIWIAIIVALITLLMSPFLGKFLNITYPVAVYFLSPIILFYILATTARSILQGLLQFGRYIISLLMEAVIKIPLSVVLILIGFSVSGAVLGLLIGIICSFIVARLFLSKYLSGKRGTKPLIIPFLKYSSATFIQGLALTSMYSSDLILVKHFFSPDLAGLYASLAVLGRIVFFGASPITHVMFPLVAKRYSEGDSHNHILYLSLICVGIISIFITLVFIFFPTFIINIFYGPSYIAGASILWWFAVFMTLLAFAMLFTQYYLSIGRTKIVWFFAAAAILQIILILFIHQTLLSVIQVSIISASLLVVSLFIYFLYDSLKCRR